jgi:hypothetical protein
MVSQTTTLAPISEPPLHINSLLGIQERNAHQEHKQELRQDVQSYKNMLSELGEQRMKDFEKERSSVSPSQEPKTIDQNRSFDR